jgi:hypothetical protein
MVVVPALWRDTPGPTWAAMLRHQQRAFEERPPSASVQQRFTFDS